MRFSLQVRRSHGLRIFGGIMNDKVLLTVLLPATGGRYELRAPLDSTVEEVAYLASELLASREEGVYEANPQADLVLIDPISACPGEMLNPRDPIRALVERDVLVDGVCVAVV